MKFLPKVGLGPVPKWFYFGDDLDFDFHSDLEVAVAQQGRFALKSTVAQKR